MPLHLSLLALPAGVDSIKGILWSAGPRGLLLWQWLALVPMAAAAVLLGRLLARITSSMGRKLTAKTGTQWDDRVLDDLGKPIGLAWAVGLLWASLPLLDATGAAESFLRVLLRAVLFAVFFWSLLRMVEVGRQFLATRPWAQANPASRSLLQLGTRAAKVVTFVIAVIAIVSELGYPVGSLLAGLGIGGLAVALAAQKTLENLFGAFAIGGDRLFREGDQVTIDTVTGTVESIGLRSIRIRTAERSVVSMPNAKVADSRIETFAPRDRIRFACVLALVYDTTAEQLRTVITDVDHLLKTEEHVAPESVTVFFLQLNTSSLDIQVAAQVLTTDGNEFNRIRQDLLLKIMDVVERSGTSFAFPTQTVQLEPPPTGEATGAVPSGDRTSSAPTS